MYLAMMSASIFTGEPARRSPRVVLAAVCGISDTVRLSLSVAVTVRLAPSNVTEPLTAIYFSVSAGTATFSSIAMPSLTTDIIVGFPGETEKDFQETLDVVRQVRYDSAFTFIYSKRTGTPAAAMEDQIPEDVVKDRFDRLLTEVQKIAGEMCSVHQGSVQTVLVESVNEHDPELMTGRLSNNLLVHFPGDESLIGKLVDVSLDKCRGFYYIGRQV